ncbi:MAG: HD-GYP domain-containing protein [Anaerolineaceae bacterium]|nr:HD-GYP domain-containing protein [Anaerolineaceae bacterium]
MGQAASSTLNPILPKSSHEPSRWLTLYTVGVTCTGALFLVIALLTLPWKQTGLMVFAGLAALAELANVELYNSSRSRVSVSSVIGIASIILFGPLAGAITHVASGLMTMITTSLRTHKPERRRVSLFRRSTFNMAMFVTAASMAGLAYRFTGGQSGNVMVVTNLIPILAAATVDVLANLIILIGVISLQTHRPMLQIWNDEFQWAAPIAIAGNILGAVLALAYEMFTWLGLTVFMLPILATSYSFRLYVANTKVYVEKLQHMNEELDDINLGLLETLGAVIDAYDVYTYGHSTQVAVYAGALADKLGLPEAEKLRLLKAALVHDLGKVAVEDSIIGKQGPLTDEEYNLVKRHPVIGAQIVGRMKGFQDLIDPVLHHHERWDGRGYPDGLVGEEIHLGARILALADALDSMFSDRPYRPTRSYKDVIAEVARCSGTQFDPVVAQAFFALAEEKGREFFLNSALTVDKAIQSPDNNDLDHLERYLKRSSLP